jgi:hypothetical protein
MEYTTIRVSGCDTKTRQRRKTTNPLEVDKLFFTGNIRNVLRATLLRELG